MLTVETPADRFTDLHAGLIVDPARFEIVEDSWWLDSLKDASGRDDIVLVRRKDGQGWTVGVWIIEPWDGHPYGVVLELEAMTKHPDHIDSDAPTIEYMLIRLRPADSSIKRFLKAQDAIVRRRQALRDADVAYRETAAKSMRKVLGNHDPTPDLIRSGWMRVVDSEARQ